MPEYQQCCSPRPAHMSAVHLTAPVVCAWKRRSSPSDRTAGTPPEPNPFFDIKESPRMSTGNIKTKTPQNSEVVAPGGKDVTIEREREARRPPQKASNAKNPQCVECYRLGGKPKDALCYSKRTLGQISNGDRAKKPTSNQLLLALFVHF